MRLDAFEVGQHELPAGDLAAFGHSSLKLGDGDFVEVHGSDLYVSRNG